MVYNNFHGSHFTYSFKRHIYFILGNTYIFILFEFVKHEMLKHFELFCIACCQHKSIVSKILSSFLILLLIFFILQIYIDILILSLLRIIKYADNMSHVFKS